MKLTTDRHEASRGLFATAELLVSLSGPVTDISATVAPIGVKFWITVPDRSSPLLWAVPPGERPNPKFWPFDREYLGNGKSLRYISIRA